MAKGKTSAELRADAERLQKQLTELRKEARRAERAEKAKANRERVEREKAEAYDLIQIAKKHYLTVNGKDVTVYDFLKSLNKAQ